jgi:hypothetical protein
MNYLTIICVLRDGSHVIHQNRDPLPGSTGVKIGSHLALREREYPSDVQSFVIVHGGTVTEHVPA